MIDHTYQHASLGGLFGIGLSRLGWNQAAEIYRKTGNLRAVQLLLDHTKVDSTVRYLGIELEHALSIAERIDI